MGLFRKKAATDFKALATARRGVEDEQPWFSSEDGDDELNVETGIGSNLQHDDPD